MEITGVGIAWKAPQRRCLNTSRMEEEAWVKQTGSTKPTHVSHCGLPIADVQQT